MNLESVDKAAEGMAGQQEGTGKKAAEQEEAQALLLVYGMVHSGMAVIGNK